MKLLDKLLGRDKDAQIASMQATVERLTKERDEARKDAEAFRGEMKKMLSEFDRLAAENEKLRRALGVGPENELATKMLGKIQRFTFVNRKRASGYTHDNTSGL